MADKLWFIIPELILFAGVVVAFLLGLAPRKGARDVVPAVAIAFLGAAFIATPLVYADETRLAAAGLLVPSIGRYVKMVVCLVGIALTMTTVGLIDRRLEADLDAGRLPFDALRTSRGEFYSFLLLSLIGVMLCCNANDLIWLFLALELTSLPTYIMVAMSRPTRRAQEAAVKYFFLGAMAAAIFLFGFALLYGSTGTIELTAMRDAFDKQIEADGKPNLFGMVGMVLALLGIAYKIAAAPMHFYAADVYEGAAAPVTAFLGFVPKTAGMIGFIVLLETIARDGSGALPEPIQTTLWMMAVLTMTLGNVGALLQRSVKRMLAYSSIAHSGYMLIGVIAGPGLGTGAVLFYLLVYGVMNTGAFAVLTALERQGREIESMDDLAGLRQRHPGLSWSMAACASSLLGFPPLLGFIAKLYLFIAGVQAGQITLVVIAGLNSAVSAWYYLRLVALPLLAPPGPRAEGIVRGPTAWPRWAAYALGAAIVILPIFSERLLGFARGPEKPDAPLAQSEPTPARSLPPR